jgi:hypothetical protein
LLWALTLRRSRRAGQPDLVPPAAVVRAWSTTVKLIGEAISAESVGIARNRRPGVAA